MLQIIGFMGCLYLLIKALEIAGRADSRPDGRLSETAMLAIVLASVGAFGFTIWLLYQGGAFMDAGDYGYAAGPHNPVDVARDAEAAASDAAAAAREAEAASASTDRTYPP